MGKRKRSTKPDESEGSKPAKTPVLGTKIKFDDPITTVSQADKPYERPASRDIIEGKNQVIKRPDPLSPQGQLLLWDLLRLRGFIRKHKLHDSPAMSPFCATFDNLRALFPGVVTRSPPEGTVGAIYNGVAAAAMCELQRRVVRNRELIDTLSWNDFVCVQSIVRLTPPDRKLLDRLEQITEPCMEGLLRRV